jgi:hypothetical protein
MPHYRFLTVFEDCTSLYAYAGGDWATSNPVSVSDCYTVVAEVKIGILLSMQECTDDKTVAERRSQLQKRTVYS